MNPPRAPRVAMLLSNAFKPHPRLGKEARLLSEHGFKVTIFAWDRLAELPPEEIIDGCQVIRLQRTPSSYGRGWRQLFYLPRYWREAVQAATAFHPDIIHCADMDTLPAGWLLKNRLGARLVFDAMEHYPALMSLYLPNFFFWALTALERLLVRSADLTLTASTLLAERYQGWGLPAVTAIPNVAELEPFDAILPEQAAEFRRDLGIPDDHLCVSYIGGFSRNRLLIPLVEAVSHMEGVTALLWGDGHQRQAVEAAISKGRNACYLGWLPADKVPLAVRMADVSYYCLAPDYPGAVYNAPNNLSFAMAAGRPILANNLGDLGRIIVEEGCGIALDEVTPQTLCSALEALRDPTYRARLGAAGRRAAERRYNWKIAGARLLEAYNRLLPSADPK